MTGGNNILVKNNFISDINHDMTGGIAFSTTFGVFGIQIEAGTGNQIYDNSVNLYGVQAGTPNSSLLTAAFAINAATSTGCDVRDNIFANNITGGTTSVAHVAVYLPSGATSTMNLTDNNNSYYWGTDVARQGAGQAGTTAGANFFVTLPALATYSMTLSPAGTNDNASLGSTGAVPFVSASDLHITGAAPESNMGVPLVAVTDDIDGDPRSPTTPDIGADEIAASPLTVSGAVSRLTHGGAGDFDIALPGIECRSTGGNYQIIVTFSNDVVSGGASVTGGTGSVSGSPTFSANTMTVNLTGVTDVQFLTVTLTGVTDVFSQVLPDTPVTMAVLIGDTNGNGTVNVGDVAQTKAQSGVPVTGANFRNDVATNGTINVGDVALVKSKSGNMLAS